MTHSTVQMIQTVLTVPETSSAETWSSCYHLSFLHQVNYRLSLLVPTSPATVTSPAGQWQQSGLMESIALRSLSYRYGGERVETLTTE